MLDTEPEVAPDYLARTTDYKLRSEHAAEEEEQRFMMLVLED